MANRKYAETPLSVAITPRNQEEAEEETLSNFRYDPSQEEIKTDNNLLSQYRLDQVSRSVTPNPSF